MTTLQGSWIWYELVTPDTGAAKAFYKTIVPGWSLQSGSAETNSYGFISNADGGMTGGLLELTDAMCEHGAQPCWLGYIGVDDCDAAVAAVEAAGGKCLMPAHDVPMAGRIAMVANNCCGSPFYVMTPTPQHGGGESTAFAQNTVGRCGWNEMLAGNQATAIAFIPACSAGPCLNRWTWGRWAHMNSSTMMASVSSAIMQVPEEAPKGWSYFRVPSISAANEAIPANGGQVVNGPMEVPGGNWIVQGI